jgi:hypothetical protein
MTLFVYMFWPYVCRELGAYSRRQVIISQQTASSNLALGVPPHHTITQMRRAQSIEKLCTSKQVLLQDGVSWPGKDPTSAWAPEDMQSGNSLDDITR